MKLNEAAKDLLRDVVALNGWYVNAKLIPPAGRLIEAGYITAYDDYEGPQLVATDRGIAGALRMKLVRRSTAEELNQPYQGAYVRIASPPPLSNQGSEE